MSFGYYLSNTPFVKLIYLSACSKYTKLHLSCKVYYIRVTKSVIALTYTSTSNSPFEPKRGAITRRRTRSTSFCSSLVYCVTLLKLLNRCKPVNRVTTRNLVSSYIKPSKSFIFLFLVNLLSKLLEINSVT